jgi:hypothetical protein
VGNDQFESVLTVSFQLANEAIIGCKFLKDFGVSINSDRGTFSYVRGAELREHSFTIKVGFQKVISDDRRERQGILSVKTTHPEVSDLSTLN